MRRGYKVKRTDFWIYPVSRARTIIIIIIIIAGDCTRDPTNTFESLRILRPFARTRSPGYTRNTIKNNVICTYTNVHLTLIVVKSRRRILVG